MSKNALDILKSAKLVNYIEKHYVLSGMHDIAFAEKAAAELGFYVGRNHVAQRRAALGIDSNYERSHPKPIEGMQVDRLLECIALVERRVTALEFELASFKNHPVNVK